MLETKNLTKVYKPKKGVPVTALDGVSIKFPEKGMVFLLGKSGSGKSTLLHMLGGLDRYDDGEVIIKGVSSRTFRQKHFDSYRNTYIGFIFQDYNVLDEFTVGANIALALELQGKKADNAEINRILKEVDLEDYGGRKPNELSGGQKQRVAIARALVKSPQIIMADEPTGALDSATGKQVFDTLKKLSKSKLVIVVSHDREFAEKYADRIIELADGKVVDDVEITVSTENCTDSLKFDGDVIEVSVGYQLTEDDRNAINKYLSELKNPVKIKATSAIFGKQTRKTDTSAIVYNDKTPFKLIKSRLPMKSAVKIGASGLKYKKIRLVITILLSCIAFGLFGLSDTLAAYNHIKTCTNSIIDTGIDYAAMTKAKKIVYSGNNFYYRDYGYTLNSDEIAEISKSVGINLNGVYLPFGADLNFQSAYNHDVKFTDTDYHIYCYAFNGFSCLNNDVLSDMGYKLACGTLPDGTRDEIGISLYAVQTFIKGGYTDGTKTYKDAKGETKIQYETITVPEDMLGKTLTLAGKKYTVTCIVDTGFDLSRYIPLTEKKEGESSADNLVNYALYNELMNIRGYSYNQVAFVGDGFVERLVAADPSVKRQTKGNITFYQEKNNDYRELYPSYIGTVDDVSPEMITWLNKGQTQLNDKEIIVSSYLIPNGMQETVDEVGNVISQFVFPSNIGKFIKNGYIEGVNEDGSAKTLYNEGEEYTIVGYIDSEKYPNLASVILASEKDCADVTETDNGPYSYCIGKMPTERADIEKLISYCYREDRDIRYSMQNSVTYQLDALNDAFVEVAKVFLYIGLGFALFAAIMLANFIGTSISYKKREIGILRAIGSRSNDVFRIFFSESFIIAIINFLLSSIGVFAATTIINIVIRKEIGLYITVLNFGIRQIVLLLAVSILIAAVASFIPVKRIASKRPIDAIRDR